MRKHKVFISYSHKDKRWKDRLVTHLSVLEKQGLLEVWVDDRIGVGSEWYQTIKKAVDEAAVAILMVTPNFLTSDFICRKEVPWLLRRRAKDGLRVFPILVSPAAWHRVKWLAKMEIRPKGGIYVSDGSKNQQEKMFAAIADEVAEIISANTRKEISGQWPGQEAKTPKELLEQYLKNLQSTILTTSIWQWKLFQWHLFALPILCRKVAPGRRTPPVSWQRLLESGSRAVLLLGEPGSGKTTFCRRVEAKQLKGLIPVDLSRKLPCGRQEALRFLKGQGGDEEEFLNGLECHERLLFIVDGIGEKPQVAEAAECLNRLYAELPHSKFLVTCRTGDYREDWLPHFERWTILELSSRTQNDFLKSQPQELRRRVLQAFAASPPLRKLCRNQILFLVAVRLLADPDSVMPTPTRAELYRQFVKHLLEKWHSLRPSMRTFIVKILQGFAVEMRMSPEGRTMLGLDGVRSVMRDYLGRCSDIDIRELIDDLCHLGLIQKSDKGIQFFQEAFQEYLCAEWLFEKFGNPTREKEILDIWAELSQATRVSGQPLWD